MTQPNKLSDARSLLVRKGPTRVRLGLPPRVAKSANETPAANVVKDTVGDDAVHLEIMNDLAVA